MQVRRTTLSKQTPPKTERDQTEFRQQRYVDIEAIKLTLTVSIFLNIYVILGNEVQKKGP